MSLKVTVGCGAIEQARYFLIVCSKRVTSTLHCFQYIRPRFIYNTDHAPLSQCSVQHIAWHCRSTVTDWL